MARRGSGLAARFKAAVEQAEAERSEEEVEAERRAAEAREERASLLEDLLVLGRELPIDASAREGEDVIWRRGAKQLRFAAADDDGSVSIDYSDRKEDDVQRLFRQQELGDRWVWSRLRRGRESRLPLFDQALELLLVHALGLPDPSAFAAQGAAPAHDHPDAGEDAPEGRKRNL